MTFTGTLIEDLLATVERVEQRAHSNRALVVDPLVFEPLALGPSGLEPWLISLRENAEYDSKLSGVA